MAGLATDYCVQYSALDARRLGFETAIVLPGCRAIDLAGSLASAITAMREAGVALVDDNRLNVLLGQNHCFDWPFALIPSR